MNENMASGCESIAKWLRVLMCTAIVSLVNSVISFLPFVPADLTTWVSRGVMVAMIICMFQLAPAHPRYQKAGIYWGVALALTLITSILFASSFLILVASVFSIMAVYQEYNAHSELIADKDSKLSGRWHSLFYWGFFATLLLSFGASAVSVILVMSGVEVAGAPHISDIVTVLLSGFEYVIDVVYLLYLRKMINYFQNEGEEYSNDA